MHRTVVLIWLLACATIAAGPQLASGWIVTHDGGWHLERLFGMANEFRLGNFYPRWISAANFGKGSPIFNFYSPGFYLITTAAHILGMPILMAIKAVTWLVFFGGGAAMYLWTKKHLGNVGGLVSGTVYIFLPYHFLDIYVRGAFPEFLALAILPLLFFGIDLCFSEGSSRAGVAVTAGVTVAVILVHNITALMVLPFVAAYAATLAVFSPMRARGIGQVILGGAFGVAASSFYWIPMVCELKYLHNFYQATGGNEFSQHFLYLSQFVSPFWGFGISVPGPGDGMGFQLGYLLTILVVLSVGCLPFSKCRAFRVFCAVSLTAGILGLALTLPPSSILYESLPILHFIQFPWRFLGIATLFLAAVSGGVAGALPLPRYGAVCLLVIVGTSSLYFSQGQRTVREATGIGDLDAIEKTVLARNELGTLGTQSEYTPRWVDMDSAVMIKRGVPFPVSGEASGDIQWSGSLASGMVETRSLTADILFPCFYFPGWTGEIDGREINPVISPQGFIILRVAKGLHHVRLYFGTTWPRKAGWGITAMTVALAAIGPMVASRIKFRSNRDKTST